MRNNSLILAGALIAVAAISVQAQDRGPLPPLQPASPTVISNLVARYPGAVEHRPKLPRPVDPESSAALIILSGDTEPQTLSQTDEDLKIMSRILEKAASEDGENSAMGIAIRNNFLISGSGPRNMYLAGYGALFILNVPFPLSPPEKGSDQDEEKKTETEWDQARAELHQSGSGPQVDFSRYFARSFGPAQPYDQRQVEDLKNDLIAALKNAVHIRSLKANEQVTIVINGGKAGGGGGAVVSRSNTSEGEHVVVRQESSFGSQTRMILQAKRPDIESFQKGKTSIDDFRKKVLVTMY